MRTLIASLIMTAALAGLSGCKSQGSTMGDFLWNMFIPDPKDDDPIKRLQDEGYGYGNNKPRPSKPSEVDGFGV